MKVSVVSLGILWLVNAADAFQSIGGSRIRGCTRPSSASPLFAAAAKKKKKSAKRKRATKKAELTPTETIGEVIDIKDMPNTVVHQKPFVHETDGSWEGPQVEIPDIQAFDLTGGRPGAIIETEEQLDRKDEQISNLNERMHESNVLMKELQERLAIAAPVALTAYMPQSQRVTRPNEMPATWRRPVATTKPVA